MSKTPKEKLQQFSQNLIDNGRYNEGDLEAFEAKIINLFNEPALNKILFKFYNTLTLTPEAANTVLCTM